MGELGWEHADTGIASWSGLVTGGVGFDVLDLCGLGENGLLAVLDEDEFPTTLFGEVVVEDLCAAEGWLGVGDEADWAAGGGADGLFHIKSSGVELLGTDAETVAAETDGELAFGKGCGVCWRVGYEEILDIRPGGSVEGGQNFGEFYGAAEAAEGNLGRVDVYQCCAMR